MGEIEVSFTGPERELLVALLEKELRDTRVEERHTDFSPDFQAEVKQEEVLLRRMIDKLRPTVV
jgi:hypothetical protein